MDEILEILSKDARISAEEISQLTGESVASVKKSIKKYEKSGAIVKYKTLINYDLVRDSGSFVRALIEVSITVRSTCCIMTRPK